MLRERLTVADRRALLVFAVLPILLNVPWALAGHPLMSDDNLTQNYPLRVLVGEMIRHGRLPLWDPIIWSGTSLLAGWNAGAMYPGTWLFAVLPGVASYEVNVVSAGIICAVGFHLFLRQQGCSPLAGFLGALTFTYTGFMSGQSGHLGLVEGMAFAPFALLGVDGIARAPTMRDAAHWLALLGGSCGLTLLAGDPRALSNVAILVAIFALACCWRSRRRAPRLLAGVVAAAVIAVVVGAVQWLPGLSFLHGTQRSASSLSYFGAGSLGWHDLALLFVPFLMGGNGTFGMPTYAGPYNLMELSYAVGILPLAAAVAIAVGAVRPRPGQRAGVWFVTIIVSALLCGGSNTPLGRLLVRIPLYGGERLQNRNAGIGDFALCVLLAIFVDAVAVGAVRRASSAAGGDDAAGLPASAPLWRARAGRLVACLPSAVVIALIAIALTDPTAVGRFFGAAGITPALARAMWPYYGAAILLAIATAVAVLRMHRTGRAARRHLAAGIVVVDVTVFILMASYQPAPPSILAARNQPSAALAAHAGGGRIAILNPSELRISYDHYLLDQLGVDDLVILRHQQSVQGYGSAVSAGYEGATGAHEVQNLRLAGFLGPVYDELDLKVVAAVPQMFGRDLRAGRPIPIPPGPPTQPGTSLVDTSPSGAAAPVSIPPSGPWRLASGPAVFELPGPVQVSAVTLAFDGHYGPLPGRVHLAVDFANGQVTRLEERPAGRNGVTTIRLPARWESYGGAVSLSVSTAGSPATAATTAPVLGTVMVLLASATGTTDSGVPARPGPIRYLLDGPIQGLVSPARWHDAGRIGPLVLLYNTRARGMSWLEAASASSAAAPLAAGSVTVVPNDPWQNPEDLVTAPTRVLLVRSEAYASGWSVDIRSRRHGLAPGPATTLSVRRIGLLQAVIVPAGNWVVTWRYRSPRAELGLAGTAVGFIACVGLAVMGLRRRRRIPRPTTGTRKSDPDAHARETEPVAYS